MKLIIPSQVPIVNEPSLYTSPKVWGSLTPPPSTNKVVEMVAADAAHALLVSTSTLANSGKSVKIAVTVFSAINSTTSWPYILLSSDSTGSYTNNPCGLLMKQDKLVYKDNGVDRYVNAVSFPLNTKVEFEIRQDAGQPMSVYMNGTLIMQASVTMPANGYIAFGCLGCTARFDDLSGTITDTFESYTVGTKALNTVLGSMKVGATGGTGGSVSIGQVTVATPGPVTIPPGVTLAPVDGATISGVVSLAIAGDNIFNAELLPEFGYLPIYGTFSVAADHKSATLQWDTRNVTDRTARFRISSYDVPPNTSGATETVAMPARGWTIRNSTTAPSTELPAHIVSAYGMSFTRGFDGDTYVANPPLTYLKAAYPQLTVNNFGVNSSDLVDLLQGGNAYYTDPFSTTIASSNANVIILHSGFNETVDCTVSEYQAYLTTFFNLCNARGKKVIFMSIHRNLIYDQSTMAVAMQQVAAQLGAGYIDLYSWSQTALTGNLGDWMPDNYHMTQAGYTLMGQYIASQYKAIYDRLFGTGGVVVPPPSPGGGTYPAMSGPAAANFSSTPTFFDDFDGSTVSNKWNRSIFYSTSAANTQRVNGGCFEFCLQSDSMFTGSNHTGYSVIDTDPASGKGAVGFTQKYGVFEIEAKLPAGKGNWPAFWLYNHVGDDRPEVDMFEAYPGGPFDWTTGSNPPRPSRADIAVHALTEGTDFHEVDSHNMTNSGLDLSAAFHKYTVEWDTNYMRFYFDGALVWTMTNTTILNFINQYPMYILLGLGINYDTAGGPSSNTSITPVGFGSDPNNVPINVYRIKYCAAWQWNKYL